MIVGGSRSHVRRRTAFLQSFHEHKSFAFRLLGSDGAGERVEERGMRKRKGGGGSRGRGREEG